MSILFNNTLYTKLIRLDVEPFVNLIMPFVHVSNVSDARDEMMFIYNCHKLLRSVTYVGFIILVRDLFPWWK